MEERRRFPRLVSTIDVDYKPLQGDRGLVVSASKNISACGVCIFLKEPVANGTLLEVAFSLPGGQRLFKLIGKVVWVKGFEIGKSSGYEAGIEFSQISEEERQLINSYVVHILGLGPNK